MGATLDEVQTLVKEAIDRSKAIDEKLEKQIDEAKVAEVARKMLNDLLTDPSGELATKLKQMWAANAGDARLAGSKFAKFGLTLGGIEATYDLLVAAKEAGISKKGPSEELTNAFNHLSGAHFLTADECRAHNMRDLNGEFQRYKGSQQNWDRKTWAAYESAVKAMDTAESGYGSQLIGAQYVGDLWLGARRASRLFQLIETVEMTAPTTYIPVEADLPEMLFVSENTSATASDYSTTKTGTNRVQLDAKKFIFHQVWSGEMEEDSIVPFIEMLLMQIREAMAVYSDSLYLNGDTTNAGTGNINLDDADPADTKHYLAFDGIRHAWIVDATGQGINQGGAAITWNALQNLKQLMVDGTYYHDWGNPSRPEDLVYLCDPETANEIGKLPELNTADKYLDKATVLTGEVAKIGLNPLIPLPAYKKTKDDGKISNTGSNNTLGQVTAFNRRGVKAGWRRQVKVETERLPGRDQTRIVYSMRLSCGRYTPSGNVNGIKWTAGIRNIALATT